MLGGLAGRREVTAPKSWPALNAKLRASKNAELRNLAQQLSQIFGDESASQAALATLRDANADLEARRNALSDRLEECAHRVPGKPWIGRANHDDGMGHDINRTVPRGQCGRERWTLLPSPFESQRGDLF